MKKKFGEYLSYGDLSLIVSGVWEMAIEEGKHYSLYVMLKDVPSPEWFLDSDDVSVIVSGLDDYIYNLRVGKLRRDAYYGNEKQAVDRMHTLQNLFRYWEDDNK